LDDLPELGLAGDHQQDNVSVALTVLLSLRKQGSHKLTEIPAFAGKAKGGINNALQNTKWPARMEKISNSPEIWFDCGHNREGAEAIAKQLKQWRTKDPDRPIHLVLGLAGDKDPNDFLAPLWPYIDDVTCVDLPNARNPQSAKTLKMRINAQKPVKIGTIGDVMSGATDLTMITGSLYLYEQVKIP
jgi:dihydrofolate synthase/folylpolyglutamate synthase